MAAEFLDGYGARLGLARFPRLGPGADAAGLFELHEAHALAIPFENGDIQLGLGVSLELARIFDKLVTRRRGGYCFEQNGLFAAALEALGFSVTRLGARVRLGATGATARTHKLLAVAASGRTWLCDVGFGADGLYRPLPLEPGEHDSDGERYRLRADGDTLALAVWRDGAWLELYAFTREPLHAIDFEVANWFTSTHPGSRFVKTLTAQRLVAGGERRTLRNRELSIRSGDQVTTRTIATPDELVDVLAELFDLRFPAGTRFRAVDFTG
jgi:N-hydroxyarylamine O-acetyltransferase